MNIRIIRGTKQVGGSAVEITTKKARVFFDFGAELNDNPKKLIVNGVTKGKTNCDAVFFSHNHGDHVGLMNDIKKDISLYIGNDAKNIMLMLAKRTNNKMFNYDRVKKMKTYKANVPIKIKDIVITPFFVDHSAFDSYMFLIEADDKRVLYTGDFRIHGFIGNKLGKILQKYVGLIDVAICEGTIFSSENNHTFLSERELQKNIKKVIDENKYVFVMCASTNIYRLASVSAVVPRGKYCLMDKFQYDLVKYIRDKHAKDSKIYDFKKALIYSEKIEDKYKKQGFVMFVRQGKYFKDIMKKFPNAKFIYSMWEGYLDKNENKKTTLREWIGDMDITIMHTSGHADPPAFKLLHACTKPRYVIPIHTEVAKNMATLFGIDNTILADDNQLIEVKGWEESEKPVLIREIKEAHKHFIF